MVVHVPFPKATREYRDELIKQAAKMAEDAKTRVRNVQITDLLRCDACVRCGSLLLLSLLRSRRLVEAKIDG